MGREIDKNKRFKLAVNEPYRRKHDELQRIREEYGVDTLWSWSRFNTYKTSPYEYFLRYVRREKPERESIYLKLGSDAHEVIENFYLGELAYNDMYDDYISRKMEVEIMGLKFVADDEKNAKMRDKYFGCCEQFYKSHQVLEGHIWIEQFIVTKIDDIIFTGYIDAVNKIDDTYYITDWKTSTAYKGKKILKEQGQLLLYAYALHQKGVPYENIVARWNFLKYVNVSFTQKNGKVATRQVERCDIVKSLKARILSFGKDLGYDENELAMIVEMNDFSLLPEDLQEIFTLEDCYVEVNVTEENINDLLEDIKFTVNEVKNKTKEYKESIEQSEDGIRDDSMFCEEIQRSDSFYFANLCSYTANLHKPYAKYLEELKESTAFAEQILDLGL